MFNKSGKVISDQFEHLNMFSFEGNRENGCRGGGVTLFPHHFVKCLSQNVNILVKTKNAFPNWGNLIPFFLKAFLNQPWPPHRSRISRVNAPNKKKCKYKIQKNHKNEIHTNNINQTWPHRSMINAPNIALQKNEIRNTKYTQTV